MPVPSPPPESTIAVTVENSVCSKHPSWLDARPWNVKASTRCGCESCASLGAHSGECGHTSSDPVPVRLVLGLVPVLEDTPSLHWYPPSPTHLCLWSWGLVVCQPSTMGQLGVKDTAAPEVKFLDRCKINCSEGALQVLVRRSRMRVWGAKMIRHRRSPQL